jgi:hypothetical protein
VSTVSLSHKYLSGLKFEKSHTAEKEKEEKVVD